MRYLLTLVVTLLILAGCNRLFGSHTSPLKDVKQSGQLQYKFAIPQASFAIGDTLEASVTVLNESSATETVFVGGGTFAWNWHLYNSSNTTVMFGGWYDFMGYNVDLAPHQSKMIYEIHQAIIADTSGHPIQPGPYVLNAKANGLPFSLIVILK